MGTHHRARNSQSKNIEYASGLARQRNPAYPPRVATESIAVDSLLSLSLLLSLLLVVVDCAYYCLIINHYYIFLLSVVLGQRRRGPVLLLGQGAHWLPDGVRTKYAKLLMGCFTTMVMYNINYTYNIMYNICTT